MSLKEIKEMIERIAVLEEKSALLQEEVNEIKNEINELGLIVNNVAIIKELEDKDNPYLNKNISYLELSVRSTSCLNRASCNKISDILAMGSNIFKIRNLGIKSAREILLSLKCLGFEINRFGFNKHFKEEL